MKIQLWAAMGIQTSKFLPPNIEFWRPSTSICFVLELGGRGDSLQIIQLANGEKKSTIAMVDFFSPIGEKKMVKKNPPSPKKKSTI